MQQQSVTLMKNSSPLKDNFAPIAPGWPRQPATDAAHNSAKTDIQRLRSLVNILNMRIELLENELAGYRSKSNVGSD